MASGLTKGRPALAVPTAMAQRWSQRLGGWLSGWGGGVLGPDGQVALPIRSEALSATESTVVAMPAVWKCAGFLANAVASCAPPTEYDSNGDRVSDADRSNVTVRPWAFLTAHEYWVQVVLSLLLHGNFIGILIDRDPQTGYPRQVLPVPVGDVTPIWDNGMPVYGWAGEAFGWDEVVHIRNGPMSPGGLWGVGVVEQFRDSLSAGLDLDRYGRSMYTTGAEASVVIHLNRPRVDPEEAQLVQNLWIERHASGIRRPAVLPSSMTVEKLSFSPEDAQYLASRQFSIAEIAFMFLMDPTDLTAVIGQGGSITYANREQREIERLTHPVGHLIRRVEQSWADLLPGRRSMAFNVERLLRTDTLSRMQATDIGLGNGTFTLNDARNIERLPTYGEWANAPFASPAEGDTVEPVPPTAEAV